MNDSGIRQSSDNYPQVDLISMLNGQTMGGLFPKEYQRKWLDHIDRRFALIWLGSFMVHFSLALYFTIHPPALTMKRGEIDRIQKQYARLVLNRELPPAASETESATTNELSVIGGSARRGSRGTGQGSPSNVGSGAGSGSGFVESGTHGTGAAGGTSAADASREKIAQEVSSKGLLGLLTSSGSGQKSEGVADLLGDAANSEGDLDRALGGLDGLKTGGRGSRSTGTGDGSGEGAPGGIPGARARKGTRTTSADGIDNLITGIGEAKSTDIKRQGSIVVEQVSSIADESGVKSESRNSDAVSEVINSHNSSIQYCYQREIKQNPDLKGKLVIRFTITPEGKVKDVKILSSTLDNPRIEQCVVSRIARWDDFGAIDPSKGDATFRQVYTFGY